MPKCQVAVGVVWDKNNQVLITKRPYHVAQGGLWEFPGGKIEEHETPNEALLRELHEEIGIRVKKSQFMMQIEEPNEDNSLCLIVFHVVAFDGLAKPLAEQLDLQWVKPTDLSQYTFPDTNKAIISQLANSQVSF